MADTGLTADYPTAGLTLGFGQTTLSVVSDKELLAIALPRDAGKSPEAVLGPMPKPGKSLKLETGQNLLWIGPDQLLCYGTDEPLGETALAQTLDGAGYVTDVADGWIALSLDGPDAQARLDMITLLDLDDVRFPNGAVTSTVIYHLRVVIWRHSPTGFAILSAASSAHSLIHHLETNLSLFDAVTETPQ